MYGYFNLFKFTIPTNIGMFSPWVKILMRWMEIWFLHRRMNLRRRTKFCVGSANCVTIMINNLAVRNCFNQESSLRPLIRLIIPGKWEYFEVTSSHVLRNDVYCVTTAKRTYSCSGNLIMCHFSSVKNWKFLYDSITVCL